jgi:hypothetical protein
MAASFSNKDFKVHLQSLMHNKIVHYQVFKNACPAYSFFFRSAVKASGGPARRTCA